MRRSQHREKGITKKYAKYSLLMAARQARRGGQRWALIRDGCVFFGKSFVLIHLSRQIELDEPREVGGKESQRDSQLSLVTLAATILTTSRRSSWAFLVGNKKFDQENSYETFCGPIVQRHTRHGCAAETERNYSHPCYRMTHSDRVMPCSAY